MKKRHIYISIILFIFISIFIINLLSIYNRFNNVYNSVIYIEASNNEIINSGSGFVYKVSNKKNYIITSYHVV